MLGSKWTNSQKREKNIQINILSDSRCGIVPWWTNTHLKIGGFILQRKIYSQVGPEKPTQKVDLKCQSGIVKQGNLLYIWEQSLEISVSRSDRRTFILLAWFSAKLNISKYNFPNRSFVLFIRQAISLLLSSRLQLASKM